LKNLKVNDGFSFERQAGQFEPVTLTKSKLLNPATMMTRMDNNALMQTPQYGTVR
jgi:hypothetical protein